MFLHFLKIFLYDGYFNEKRPGEIVILFLKFIFNIIGNRNMASSMKFTKFIIWKTLSICIYGWCFCETNSIKFSLLGEEELVCFINSMSEYIKVVQNLSCEWELFQFPLIGHRPRFICEECYGKRLASQVWRLYDYSYVIFGLCPLHSWCDGTLLLPPS